MPLTTIAQTVQERVEIILAYRLPNNLWQRRFNDAFESEIIIEKLELSERQIQATNTAGLELFGDNEAWKVWSQDFVDLNTKQQRNVDANYDLFAERYEQLDESDIIEIIAEINKMSLTTLKAREWTTIQEILEFRLPTIY